MKRVASAFLTLIFAICVFSSETRASAAGRVKPYRPEEDNLINTEIQPYSVTEPPVYPYSLTWNIESINYYVYDSASTYTTQIANAANNWVYTGYGYNRLYPFTQTTNVTMSAADFTSYKKDNGENAVTYHCVPVAGNLGLHVSAMEEDWTYCEIRLNNFYMTGFSSTTRQGVIAHEMGHLFGLMHNDLNSYSIMCQMATGRAVYKVQQVDVNAFLKKFPN